MNDAELNSAASQERNRARRYAPGYINHNHAGVPRGPQTGTNPRTTDATKLAREVTVRIVRFRQIGDIVLSNRFKRLLRHHQRDWITEMTRLLDEVKSDLTTTESDHPVLTCSAPHGGVAIDFGTARIRVL